jgi:streptomycin 6-kinase
MATQPIREVPESFAHTIRTVFAEAGAAWLQQLPSLINACEARWQLRVQPPFKLSYNYVAPAVRVDGSLVVLKLGVPNDELTSEINALRIYAGRGICKLIEADDARGIMLLEQLQPGTLLSTLVPHQDEQATEIAAEVMRQLWQPVPVQHPFRTLEHWTNGILEIREKYNGGTGPFPAHLVAQAESLRTQLLNSNSNSNSNSNQFLLHGDLHHFNILQTEQGWRAIDPKGVVGEPAYEIASFLYNPNERLISKAMLARRIAQFSELLTLDRERLLGWGVVQAVLSAWWSFDSGEDGWQPMIGFAELVAETSFS